MLRVLFVVDDKYYNRYKIKNLIFDLRKTCIKNQIQLQIATRGYNDLQIYIRTLCLQNKIKYVQYNSPLKFKSLYCNLNDKLYLNGSIQNRSIVNKISVESSDIVYLFLYQNNLNKLYDLKQINNYAKKKKDKDDKPFIYKIIIQN